MTARHTALWARPSPARSSWRHRRAGPGGAHAGSVRRSTATPPWRSAGKGPLPRGHPHSVASGRVGLQANHDDATIVASHSSRWLSSEGRVPAIFHPKVKNHSKASARRPPRVSTLPGRFLHRVLGTHTRARSSHAHTQERDGRLGKRGRKADCKRPCRERCRDAVITVITIDHRDHDAVITVIAMP